jgi:hypothetical protein
MLLTFIAFAFLISIQSVSAADIIINPTDSIQTAIDNANPQDTIILNTGTYNQNSIVIDKELTLKSSTENPEDVTIDAQDSGRVMEIATGINNVQLLGLTITNGLTDGDGAGIYNRGGTLAQPNVIDNCVIISNYADGSGGGVYNSANCYLTITNCDIKQNYANTHGGGVNNYGTLNIIQTDISQNSARTTGGGIRNYGTLNVNDCDILNNAASVGGGIYTSMGTATIDNTIIQENTASSSGGGICVNNVPLTITNSQILKNTAGSGGGGLYCDDGIPISGPVTITNTVISENTANSGGGMTTYLPTTITESVISSNTARYGGGILQYNHGPLTITNTRIENNLATYSWGGGIYSETYADAPLTVQNCKITDNTAQNGGGIYDYNEGGTTTITNCEFSGNTATQAGGAFYRYDDEGDVVLNFNRIVSNSAATGANIYNNRNSNFNAENNWWGSNDGPTGIAEGSQEHIPVDADPWLILEFSANPTTISQGQTSNLMAHVNRNSDGVLVGDATNHIPDGTPITLTTNLGNVGSKSITVGTINGVATAILRGDEAAGTALISATLDSQTLYATVTITPTAATAASTTRTIGMQTTGAPILGLILAILLIASGMTVHSKK